MQHSTVGGAPKGVDDAGEADAGEDCADGGGDDDGADGADGGNGIDVADREAKIQGSPAPSTLF